MLTTSFQQFAALLVVHFIGDFVLQTHWQASNKSKRLDALLSHVGVYTGMLWLGAWVIFPGPIYNIVLFVGINGLAHLWQDAFTSRWSALHFAPAISDVHKAMSYAETYGHAPDDEQSRIMGLDAGRHFHNFFEVIGLDQLAHFLMFFVTMAIIFGAR